MLWKIVIALAIAALLPVLFFGAMSVFSSRPKDLGLTEGKLKACPAKPNCVCSQVDGDQEHSIAPLKFEGDPAAAWQRLQAVVKAEPRAAIVTVDDKYLHAEYTSLIFRYVDDVEFVLAPETHEIHCRSASRAGYSDLGVNRKRIEAIRAAFAAR